MLKVSKRNQIVIRPARKNRRRRRRNRRSQIQGINAPMQPTVDYFKSLVDPFECSPPKLGWGCMVPSTITQAYFRSSFTANADGSLAVMALPSASGGILFNSSSTSGTTWTVAPYSNAGSIFSTLGEGRPISIGVKATPNIALTSIPGMCYSGAVTPTTAANLVTLTPSDLVSMVTSHQSIATNGATATGRPIDPDSFTFNWATVNSTGWAGVPNNTATLNFSVPYIVFIGLPTLSQVFVEFCFNIEGTPVVGHNQNTNIPATEPSGEQKLSDTWQNPETMYNRMKPYLPHPGRASDAAAAKDSGFLQTVLSGIGGIAGTILGGPLGTAIGTVGGNILGTAAQSLFSGSVRSRPGASQDYSRVYGGYKL